MSSTAIIHEGGRQFAVHPGSVIEIDRQGLEPGADPKVVRRAYLRAAKRLHPDRLLQLGLEDLKTEANEVFAEITRAHTVLSDPEERRRYEESDEAPETDADRIAEAVQSGAMPPWRPVRSQ